MKKPRTIFLASLLLAATAWAKTPNVILIITDDQGYGDLEAHGNPVIKTPHMNRLHEESVRFTDFHVAPMCTPTRGQLMTGLDAMKNGATAVCQGRSMMRNNLKIMPQFFAEAGYATGLFGKWHLGDSYPHRPQDRGFQEVLRHRAWGITSLADYWENSYFDPTLERNSVDTPYKGYCTDIYFDEAMTWIETCQAKGKPFFLYLPTNTPHVPNVVAEDYSTPYRGSHQGKPIPDTFYGMIANIDENLGKLEAFLKAKKLRDNTILIFMSDNGTQSQGAKNLYNAGMRDKKTSVFEGGHRVPLFMRWIDGKVQHGRDVKTLTHVQDLLPTLIDLCDLKAEGAAFDGASLSGLLRGNGKMTDRMLVAQYRVDGGKWNPAVVMWNQWRLLPGNKLYDIGKDPHQDKNVSAAFPEVASKMSAHYNQWYQVAKPLFDQKRYIVVGSEQAPSVTLYASDWQGSYCDNWGGLSRANGAGYWDLIVEKPGTYEVELRRWPEESGLALTAEARGKHTARPIAAANLQIAGKNYRLETRPEDTHATFVVKLDAGKTMVETSLMNQGGAHLTGAIYTKFTLLDKAAALTPESDRKPNGPTKAQVPATIKMGPKDILIADFEQETYGDWKTTGEAFRDGPAEAHKYPRNRYVGEVGKRLVNSFHQGDKTTGTLTSPAFKIQREFINFFIGGGNHTGKTCMNLLIEGKIVRTATGPAQKNTQGRCPLVRTSWDVAEFKGQQATLQIVDNVTGGWGHVTVDHVFQSNKAFPLL